MPSWLTRPAAPQHPVADDDRLRAYAASKGLEVGFDREGEPLALPPGLGGRQIATFVDYWLSTQLTEDDGDAERARRVAAYEQMDRCSAEAGITLDTFADEALGVGLVEESVSLEVPGDPGLERRLRAFVARNKLFERAPGHIRSLMKYGDLGMRLKGDPETPGAAGLTVEAVPAPKWRVFRPEGAPVPLGYVMAGPADARGRMPSATRKRPLQPWEFVQFTVPDEELAPYGRSVLEAMRPAYDQLVTIEALLAMSRASKVERIVIKVPVNTKNPVAAASKLTSIRAAIKNSVFKTDAGGGRTRGRTPALTDVLIVPSDDGFVIDKMNSSIDLSTIEDVEYFRDKYITASGLPKGFLLADEGSALGNRGLQAQDLKFARKLIPYQNAYVAGLTELLTLVAVLDGSSPEMVNVRVSIRRPSNINDAAIDSLMNVFSVAGTIIDTADYALGGEMTDRPRVLRGVLAHLGVDPKLTDVLTKGAGAEALRALELPRSIVRESAQVVDLAVLRLAAGERKTPVLTEGHVPAGIWGEAA